MKRIAATAILAAALVAAAGCKNNGSSSNAPAGANSPTPVGAPAPNPVNPNAARLRSGNAPINYLVGPGGKLRVVDATTGKDIAKVLAPPQSTLTVDPARGVLLGTTTLTKGPLPANHKYEIWLDK
jgi:hypothetical protein